MSSIKYLLKDFKLPGGVIFEHEEVKADYGRFIAKPFEKGFAVTIGNSLRRALLSSIPGSAIVAAKIDGVSHEFSTIPGVMEDTTDILINMKKVRIKLADNVEKKIIHIEKKGPGELLAKDLNVDADIEILNPDFYLASLSKTGSISMDLQIEHGRGYVPSEDLKDRIEDDDVSIILLDAIFTPVIKVNYKVENIRVGQRIDFEKLVLEVWTDG
ncbi:MAG: DNA-directed RNA polymerase subunit alpha, partial [Spirochaetes bacterium]|nr:DNA-directed RNA polymerase subunit alpha [Spirochaetota bacterium]